MSGLKTWTVRCADCAIVVTADDVDSAIWMIENQFAITVQRSELIILPTHHRYARMLTPTGETVRIDAKAAIVAELDRLEAVWRERIEEDAKAGTRAAQAFCSGIAGGLSLAINVVQAGGALPSEEKPVDSES